MREKTRDVERVSYRKCEYQVVHSLLNEGHTRSDTHKRLTSCANAFPRKPKGTNPKETVRLATRL